MQKFLREHVCRTEALHNRSFSVGELLLYIHALICTPVPPFVTSFSTIATPLSEHDAYSPIPASVCSLLHHGMAETKLGCLTIRSWSTL